jgi:hypothetical protein
MTNEKNTVSSDNKDSGVDYSGRPFGYVAPTSKTAMLCEADPASRDKISRAIKEMGFELVQPAIFKDAIKYMRFHIFDLILVNENFSTGIWDADNIMKYLENVNMSVRRKIFVVLISSNYATMDNMQAYNKNVNMIINVGEIADIEDILKQSLAEHNDFYSVFKESINKYGRV